MGKPRIARVRKPRIARSTRINVIVTDGRGRAVRAPGLAAWLDRIAPARARGDIGIAIVSDARIREFNARFRRRDKVTDVLSFPGDAPPAFAASRLRRGKPASSPAPRASHLAPRFLGDIVIARGLARRQARVAGHSYAVELKILALHGLLHHLGYDHHDPADGGRMARLERRLRAKGGLRAGLIERVRAGVGPREAGK
jgi:probable rRNA maturation factor